MYYKDDLMQKDIAVLADIAREIGADATISDQEMLVYDILEKQATNEAAKNPLGGKRKRTRIVKKDSDHVYSVNGKEGENYDTKKAKQGETFEQISLFKELQPEANTEQKTEENKEQKTEESPIEETPKTSKRSKKSEGGKVDALSAEEQLAAMPKHRGRKSKKELELIAAIEAQKAQKIKEDEDRQPRPLLSLRRMEL